MGTLKKFLSKTHFNLLHMGSEKGVFYLKMVLVAGFFLASVSRLLFTLFRFINRVLLRYTKNNSGIISQENNLISSNLVEQEAQPEVANSEIFKNKNAGFDGFGTEKSDCFDEIESESPKFEFKFRFQTFEEFSKSNRGDGDFVSSDNTTPSTNTNKYEFLSGKSSSHFLEEPEAASFKVKELYADSNKALVDNSVLSEGDFLQQNSVEEVVQEEIPESRADRVCEEEVSEKLEATTFAEDAHSEKEQLEKSENVLPDKEDITNEDKFLSEKDFIASDSDSDSICSSYEFSIISQLISSTSEGFLSDKDFQGTIDGVNLELTEEDFDLESIDLQHLDVGYEPEDFDEEDSDIMEELQHLEESDMKNSDVLDSEKFSEDVSHDNSNSQEEEFGEVDKKPMDEKPNSKNSSEWDSEDPNGLETLWEHQELLEQLKMELKKVRATGLPTILEESECPKIMEDLKPWKIDEKFQHGGRMGELHKFYKSYRERMRKFDILNYQKMYAIGVLQSKDPLKSFSSHKSSAPAITSIFSQSFRLCKRKKSEFDPMMKFIRDLHCDLEMVYVGQLCLSWEFLHWQYEKALELWESADPYGLRLYNEVAGEFQQFQVLMQRFIENEPFQGPRVENYVKNRCVTRNLLQVPVIREDKRKDRRRRDDDGAITTDMLVEILEESIRIIWQFVRGDKDANNTILMRQKEPQVELQNPADSVLLMEVRTDLQKKEKKIKDVFRSGKCILKRLQKHQDDEIDHLYFFSQVDMKLVSRVLNMSRITTDQLVWCHSKLSQINFVNRKMHVEPSFLLFPC